MSHSQAAVDGLEDVRAAFKRAPEVVQLRLGEATQKTAFALLQSALALVHVRFGFLKQSLDYSFSQATGEARVGIRQGARFPIPESGNRHAGAAIPPEYGHDVEFGHGGPHPAPAYPFMIPAAESQQQPYLDRCRDAGREIERDLSSGGGLL